MVVFDSLADPKVIALLTGGGVGIIPTDTIYGIAAVAENEHAVERLYQLKQRRDDARSGTVIAASVQQLIGLGLELSAIEQAAHYWPNPLSIELPLKDRMKHLFQTGAHRAFRVVSNPELQAFLEKTGPLLTSSVNTTGMPPATNLQQAVGYFGNNVDFYVNGGDLSGRPPSTVAVLRDNKLTVVRPGAVIINSEGEITNDL